MKINKRILPKLMLALVMVSFLFTSCEEEGVQEQITTEENLALDAPLVVSVMNYAQATSNTPETECFSFSFPFNVTSYDSDNQIVETVAVNSNAELDMFFSNLSPNQYVAFNYPITLNTSANGEVMVNNDAEFQSAMDENLASCFGFGSENIVINFCSEDSSVIFEIDLADLISFNNTDSQTVSFYSTEADALAEVNPFATTLVVVDYDSETTVFARRNDSATGTFEIVQLTYSLGSCID